MLVAVVLNGQMGKAFGKNWELAVNSPAEALRMIDANKPGLFAWIRRYLKKYGKYRVTCTYEDGRKEDLDNETFEFERQVKRISFTPLVEGASAGVRFVVGAILVVVGYMVGFTGVGAPIGYALVAAGMSMMIGAVVEMLTPKPKMKNDQTERKDGTSYFFDGPVNTTRQGVPVQVIYGRVLVGSHVISANVNVEQLPT